MVLGRHLSRFRWNTSFVPRLAVQWILFWWWVWFDKWRKSCAYCSKLFPKGNFIFGRQEYTLVSLHSLIVVYCWFANENPLDYCAVRLLGRRGGSKKKTKIRRWFWICWRGKFDCVLVLLFESCAFASFCCSCRDKVLSGFWLCCLV